MLLVATVTFVSYIQTSFPWSQTRDRTGWDEYDSLLSNPATLLRSSYLLTTLEIKRRRKKESLDRWIGGAGRRNVRFGINFRYHV